MRVVREVIITCLVIAAITGFALAAPPDLDKYRTCNYCGIHGGTLNTFDDSVSAAYLDMYKDTKTIRERRKAKHRGSSEGPR
ncbi:hypothetical protein [Citrifermentans bremense]|uniref:hypothetical protein n=1 Tax=Citrifermentans bremense TaxID=60035 RepID=UPI0004015F44|nr:hypothetical protein [Citrifermentans bremense]